MYKFFDRVKLLQAYQAFYGKNINFDNKDEEIYCQILISILLEYNILDESFENSYVFLKNVSCDSSIERDVCYIPFSYQVRRAFDLLKKQTKDHFFQELLESNSDVSLVDKSGIRSVSAIISNHIKSIDAEPLEYLKKLANVLYLRRTIPTFLMLDSNPISFISESIVTKYDSQLGYSKEEVEEVMKFICSELGLLNSTVRKVSPLYAVLSAKKRGIDLQTDNLVWVNSNKEKVLVK